jgi:hypothetical protein
VDLFFFEHLVQTIDEVVWEGPSQQGEQDIAQDNPLKKYGLLVTIQGVELVIPSPLINAQPGIDGRMEQRREWFRNEGLAEIHGNVTHRTWIVDGMG